MISEQRFVRSYNSLWRNIAPTMELFVRKVNSRLYKRNWALLASNSAPAARSLINQVAFQSLVDAVASSSSFNDRVRFVENKDNMVAAELFLTDQNLMSSGDLDECSSLAQRMFIHLFRLIKDEIFLKPTYKGCGIINACFGDALSNVGRIIELKDGDRPFRSYDFRQVTIYGALHLNGTGQMPSSFAVINSRRGISVELSIDNLAAEVAGQSGYEYLQETIRVISDLTIS